MIIEILIDIAWCITGIGIGLMVSYILDRYWVTITHDGKTIFTNKHNPKSE